MTSPPPNRQNQTPAVSLRLQWPMALVTGLVGALVVWLAWPKIFPGPGQADEMTLPGLDRRASQLRQITDPVKRDAQCNETSAGARSLDRALAPDAHAFLAGMLGKENASKLGYYFFLRNYLFPREVEISLDRKAIFHEWWFEGVSYKSPAELRANGFDILLRMPTNGGEIEYIALTRKGVPK
jgi:hypothetical protein